MDSVFILDHIHKMYCCWVQDVLCIFLIQNQNVLLFVFQKHVSYTIFFILCTVKYFTSIKYKCLFTSEKISCFSYICYHNYHHLKCYIWINSCKSVITSVKYEFELTNFYIKFFIYLFSFILLLFCLHKTSLLIYIFNTLLSELYLLYFLLNFTVIFFCRGKIQC